ncbi:hypothetical protein MRX96_009729 [Rhipicephalus microplus]
MDPASRGSRASLERSVTSFRENGRPKEAAGKRRHFRRGPENPTARGPDHGLSSGAPWRRRHEPELRTKWVAGNRASMNGRCVAAAAPVSSAQWRAAGAADLAGVYVAFAWSGFDGRLRSSTPYILPSLSLVRSEALVDEFSALRVIERGHLAVAAQSPGWETNMGLVTSALLLRKVRRLCVFD